MAEVPPIVTVGFGINPVPVIVTASPPVVTPVLGDMPLTVSGTSYVKPPLRVYDLPSAFVTIISTVPTAWGGVTIRSVVPFTYVTGTDTPSTVAVLLVKKFVPVSVMVALPAVELYPGEMAEIVGALAVYVKPLVSVAL